MENINPDDYDHIYQINYAYLMNRGKSLGLSSNIYKKDSQTIQLEFKFNL